MNGQLLLLLLLLCCCFFQSASGSLAAHEGARKETDCPPSVYQTHFKSSGGGGGGGGVFHLAHQPMYNFNGCLRAGNEIGQEDYFQCTCIHCVLLYSKLCRSTLLERFTVDLTT